VAEGRHVARRATSVSAVVDLPRQAIMQSGISSRYHVYALPRNVHNAGENSPKHAVQTAGLCQLAEELFTSLRRHRARSRMPWVYDRGQPVDKCIPF